MTNSNQMLISGLLLRISIALQGFSIRETILVSLHSNWISLDKVCEKGSIKIATNSYLRILQNILENLPAIYVCCLVLLAIAFTWIHIIFPFDHFDVLTDRMLLNFTV